MKYKCFKCNKEFKQKGHYDAHNNRKIPCVVNNDIHNVNNILPQNTANLPPNSAKIPSNSAKIPPNSTILTQKLKIIASENTIEDDLNKNNSFECNFCYKVFTRKDSLNKHIDGRCKVKKEFEFENNKLKEEIVKLKEENAELKTNFVKVYQEIDTLKQNSNLGQVSKSKNTKKINTNHTQSHNTNTNTNSNNTNSNNTVNNNIQQNIMLGFGNENISKVSEAEILDALKSYPNTFIKYVKAVNLNERIPENQTVLVRNSKINTASVVEDNKLVMKDKNKIIEELIQNRLPEIKQFAQDYISERKISRKEYDFVMTSINFLETSFFETEDVDGNIVKADKDTVKKLKEIYKELLYQFYDYRKMVSDNIKKLLVEPLVNPIMDLLDDSEHEY